MKLSKFIKKENAKLKIKSIHYKRYQEGNIMRHSIELSVEGSIPNSGLGSKKIIKLLKKYG